MNCMDRQFFSRMEKEAIRYRGTVRWISCVMTKDGKKPVHGTYVSKSKLKMKGSKKVKKAFRKWKTKMKHTSREKYEDIVMVK